MMLNPTPTESSPCFSSADVSLSKIPQDEVFRVAGLVAPYLESAIRSGSSRMTVGEVLEHAAAGTYQLWLVATADGDCIAAAITVLAGSLTEEKSCLVLLLGGRDLPRWKHVVSEMETWARLEGCTCMEFHGRRGWERIFPEYRAAYVVLRKELV